MMPSGYYTRVFSSSAKVHPSFLPHLRQSRRAPFRWLRAALLLSTSAVLVSFYVDSVRARESMDITAAERSFAESQHRNNALLDAYGDRSSLEELEKAIQFYEQKNSKRRE